ncbi:NUDIX domain-containing protein [Candidatus Woesearchaeota archaeon]|nr:NUDIX domain-containing protein [Candidatus Woesearchaeota archaeon]
MKPGKDFIGVGVGALILNDKNEFLMLLRGKNCKNEHGKWMVPGGAVDFNDTLEDTIKREVKEELGVEIELGEIIAVANHILPQEKQHWVSPTFKAKIISGEPKIMEPQKHDDIGWFSFDSLPENLSKATQLVLGDYLK